jgi:hypothetical protein
MVEQEPMVTPAPPRRNARRHVSTAPCPARQQVHIHTHMHALSLSLTTTLSRSLLHFLSKFLVLPTITRTQAQADESSEASAASDVGADRCPETPNRDGEEEEECKYDYSSDEEEVHPQLCC